MTWVVAHLGSHLHLAKWLSKMVLRLHTLIQPMANKHHSLGPTILDRAMSPTSHRTTATLSTNILQNPAMLSTIKDQDQNMAMSFLTNLSIATLSTTNHPTAINHPSTAT